MPTKDKKANSKKNPAPAESKPIVVEEEMIPVRKAAPAKPPPSGQSGTPSAPTPTVVKKEPPTRRPAGKLWLWIALGAVVLIGGATWAGMMLFGSKTDTTTTQSNQNTNVTVDGRVPRKIDGVLVDPDKANPNLYAIMIENLTSSRPPSGLDKASVVYEALAEGGITRFMAIYPVGTEVAEIGPIRSSRRYYISYAEEYNKPLYVHVGGSPDSLSYLRTSDSNVVDFNQFFHAPHFWRDRTRSAPHNLYSSTEKLFLGLKETVPDLVPDYESWPFKDAADLADRSIANPTISIEYSSFNYNVTFRYHPELNVYFRSHGDTEHVTRTGDKIAPTNVVVMFVETGLLPGETQRLEMETEGQGRAIVFRDGKVVEGTWKKESGRDRTEFLDSDNQPIELNRGQTWISVVPKDRAVSFPSSTPNTNTAD